MCVENRLCPPPGLTLGRSFGLVAVSVILPSFNRSNVLAGAIGSVLTQSFRDLELIVVDDGSTENLKAVVETINDPRLSYVRRAMNGGAAAARNTGLLEARGEFIAFQDSDDIWLPGKLQRQLDLFLILPQSIGIGIMVRGE